MPIPLIWGANFQERFLRLFDDGSASARLMHWRFAWSWFKARPFFGNGFGSYARALSYSNPIRSLQGSNAHNLFFTFLADVGLFGTAAFFFTLFVVTLRSFHSAFLRWRSEKRVGISFAATLVLIGFLPGMIVSNVMLLSVPTVFAWIVFAMECARERIRTESSTESRQAELDSQ